MLYILYFGLFTLFHGPALSDTMEYLDLDNGLEI